MSVHYFPEEIILQILHNLPIKSLVCCTCVCKSWNSLIRNPSFISTHLTRTNNHLLLFHLRSETFEHYSLRVVNQQLAPYRLLGIPFKSFGSYFQVIGSFNGIICLADYFGNHTSTYILWNPSIKKFLILPSPRVTASMFSPNVPSKLFVRFGFDSTTNDYKVLRIIRLHGSKEEKVELYSLNTNSWKRMTCVAPKCEFDKREYQFAERKYGFPDNDMHAFVNGVVHWVAYKRSGRWRFRNVVLGFDMSNEVFLEIKLPKSLAKLISMCLSIRKYGDSSIAIIKKKHLYNPMCDIWVMKEYGVVGSWTKLFSLGEPSLPREKVPTVLGFRKSGQVLLQMHGGQIVSLDPQNLVVKDLGVREEAEYLLVDSYVESLVLLDNANAVSDRRNRFC